MTSKALISWLLPICWILLVACSRPPSAGKPTSEALTSLEGPSLGQGDRSLDLSALVESSPFLLHPALRDVREALEARDDELAALMLRDHMGKGGDFSDDGQECNYLLGVIEERRGNFDAAVVAFEVAIRKDWALRRDALTHLLDLALLRVNCARAEELLAQLSRAAFDDTEMDEAGIRVSLCHGRTRVAEAELRRVLGTSSSAHRRARYQVMLAQLILERAQSGESELDSAAREAGQLIQDVLAQANATSRTVERAKAMLGQLVSDERAVGTNTLVRERTTLLEIMVESRRWSEARQLASEILAQGESNPLDNQWRCRAMFAGARISLGASERSEAIAAFDWVVKHCDDSDLVARALFLKANQQSAMSDYPSAISDYAELERRFPTHRLADDARLKMALNYRKMGSESRFIALLDSMPDDYPNGDMLLEGLFQLALKSMLERKWPAAVLVLERANRIAEGSGQFKETDRDRVRYFLATARLESGQSDLVVSSLRSLVIERPLTYYMILAYSTLKRVEPIQADEALREAASSGNQVPSYPHNDQLDRGVLARLTALLGVGDVDRAEELTQESTVPGLYRAEAARLASLYAKAGASRTALRLVKRNGGDWRVRWPNAGWMEIWKQGYPRPYREIVRRESQRNSVRESLIYAVMREESEFDPKAASSAEAHGLMQLILPTARIAARGSGIVVDIGALQKPAVNIALGAKVLARLLERFGGQVALVAAGYNAGPGRPARWLRTYPDVASDLWVELVAYPETRSYVKRVIESQVAYEWLYEAAGKARAQLEILPARFEVGRAK